METDTKFKWYQLVYMFANKVLEDIFLNATTVTEALRLCSTNKRKIKASENFTPKYTPPTNNGSFQNKNYQLSIISYDYFIVFSNCF